jgi:hypothetical protein
LTHYVVKIQAAIVVAIYIFILNATPNAKPVKLFTIKKDFLKFVVGNVVD